jgi:hypothetical protein
MGHCLRILPALVVCLWSVMAFADQSLNDGPDDISSIGGMSFTDLKVSIKSMKFEFLTVDFTDNEDTHKLQARVGLEDWTRGQTIYTGYVPVEIAGSDRVLVTLPENIWGLARLEAVFSSKKSSIFWTNFLSGTLIFKSNKKLAFRAKEGSGPRLQYKPGCFLRSGDGGFEDEEISVQLRYTNNSSDNEDFISSKAQIFDWKLLSRELDYIKKTDIFYFDTPANGEVRALDVLSKEEKVICATRVSAAAGAPELQVRGIELGAILGSPVALPVVGVPIVRKWVEDFYKGAAVRIGDVRLGKGAEYFVSVTGPSNRVKFDDDDRAWVRLNLDLKIGSNVGDGPSGLADTVRVQIQDALRAKAPATGLEPPVTLFDVLKYWKDEDNGVTSTWGVKMDTWQRGFATFLAQRYRGELVGN